MSEETTVTNVRTVETDFLNNLINSGTRVDCFLSNGVKLADCKVKSFDDYVIVVTADKTKSGVQLLYKANIASLVVNI